MSRRRTIFVGILVFVTIAFILAVIIWPGLATSIREGLIEYGGPVGQWATDTWTGITNHPTFQMYLAPPWHAFGIGLITMGILAVVLWKKAPSIHMPFRKQSATTTRTTSIAPASTPVGATTRPEQSSAPVVSEPTKEEEATT